MRFISQVKSPLREVEMLVPSQIRVPHANHYKERAKLLMLLYSLIEESRLLIKTLQCNNYKEYALLQYL